MNDLKENISTTRERQRILLVDDDRDNARVLNRTLELEGFDTVVVSDGASALYLMELIKPDMIILDEVEPGLDDIASVDLIRAASDVPIIMLNQDYGAEALRRALFHGADDYVRKPFGPKSFVARIRAKLRRTCNKSA
jgi:two-component system, OmpR family, response regulator MtrA